MRACSNTMTTLGLCTLVKRVWHKVYLEEKVGSIAVPSTRGIARHKPESDGGDDDLDGMSGETYFAVLTLDGDEIGRWISGDFTAVTPEHHRNFSHILSVFALHDARRVVEEHDGRLIYAGGDDVLALLPADTALDCALALRNAFRAATAGMKGAGGKSLDCSAGIAIVHFKSPLQDIVREVDAPKNARSSRLGDGAAGSRRSPSPS